MIAWSGGSVGKAHFIREWTEQTARKRKERKGDRPARVTFLM